MTTSLYVHIPFCKNICTYCDFCKMYYNETQIESYLDALEHELKTVYRGEKLTTIYIGGGTPSCLNISQLKRLFQILAIVKKDENIEYTIECNFDSTNKEKLDLFQKYGINRLSFGIETTKKDLEQYLGRENDLDLIKQTIAYAKKIGLSNINVDLMYALKEETLKDLEKDLDFILSLDVPHISTYSLIIEENTVLKLKGEKELDSEIDAKMYEYIGKTLKKQGYEHYEISNFARKGFQSKHNLTYWHNQEYYGIGLGASSYIENQRIRNTRSLNQYLKGNHILEIEELTKEDKMIYEIILNLRLKEGLSLTSFEKTYNKPLRQQFCCYDKLIDMGLLQEEEGRIKIPENKLYISNYIIEELVEGGG